MKKISPSRLNQRLVRFRNLQRLEVTEQTSTAWIAKIGTRWHIGTGNGYQETRRQEAGIGAQAGEALREQVYLHVARAMAKGRSAQGQEAQG